jgi:putative membrane protein insertion efficiency factor
LVIKNKQPLNAQAFFITALIFFNLLFANSNYQALNVTANWLLSFYKKFVSPLQGRDICNFSPTCSQFSRQAINDYGFIAGLIMTSDRLLRCNPWAWQYLDYYYPNIKDGRIFDPPENHYIASSYTDNLTSNKTINLNLGEKSKKFLLEPAFVQNFADYLFNSGDYVRATSEYKRLCFLTTDGRVKLYAQMMIGESYLANSEFKNALTAFSSINDSSLLNLRQYAQARTYFKMADYNRTREILTIFKNTSLTQKSKILIGWSYFKERNFASGVASFDAFAGDSQLRILLKYNGRNLPKRSRLLSTCFSTILPGLGQIYSERFGDGFYSFLTIATTAAVSYYYWKNDESKIKFSVFSFLTTLFWAGNIYGANIAARDYNQYHTRNYLAKIDEILNQIDLKPVYNFLSVQ